MRGWGLNLDSDPGKKGADTKGLMKEQADITSDWTGESGPDGAYRSF